jgi:carbonic anhydrase
MISKFVNKETTFMSESEKTNLDRLPSRRAFLTTSAAAAALGLLAACDTKPAETKPAEVAAPPQEPPIVVLTKEARDQMTADQIIAKWKDGNTRFREGRKIQRDFFAEAQATAAGQFPAGVLLSCIDSRAPAEILFNLGMGDVFNARIAGNVENPDILGSMEFTTKLAGAKVVLVMGHSACGAVAGAIADAKLGNLTQLLAKIQPAIKATKYTGDRTAGNAEFVDAVARTNVELTMANIRKNSPVVAELEKAGSVKIAGAFYDLKTGAVDFFA